MAEARAALEKAIRRLDPPRYQPGERAAAAFSLARVLWELGDKARALELAEDARRTLEAHEASWPAALARVRGWLSSHARPPRAEQPVIPAHSFGAEPRE
jgi:hypothetical protein